MWQIIIKDLRVLTRDRRALVVLLLLPLVLIAILGISTGRLFAPDPEQNARFVVTMTGETGGVASQLEARLAAHPLVVMAPAEESDLEPVTVIIGPDFARRIETVTLQKLTRTRRGFAATDLTAFGVGVEVDSLQAISRPLAEELVLSQLLAVALSHLASADPDVGRFLSLVQAPMTERIATSDGVRGLLFVSGMNADIYSILVPAYTVLFVFFLINIMARSHLAERDAGTLDRLRMSPLAPAAVVAGKTLPFLVISLVQITVLFLSGRLLFGMSWGADPALLIPVGICTALSATGLGLVVATFARTDAQVSAYGNLIVIALGGISGCFMPRMLLPDSLLTLSLATPHAWALIAFHELLAKPAPDGLLVLKCCGVLTGFAVGLLTIGCWRFSKIGDR